MNIISIDPIYDKRIRSIRSEYPNLSNIFCFIRVKLFAKIQILFHTSNKTDVFLFLLLIINRFGERDASSGCIISI